MSKIGRNDPCSCGSGKKYKKCHWGKHTQSTQPNAFNKTVTGQTQPLQSPFLGFDKIAVLHAIAALQLHPRNHGKNIRFERIVFELLKSAEHGSSLIGDEDLKSIFSSRFLSDYLEDPVSGFFTENTIFFGGNYTVFPGITEHGTQILNGFLEAIFTTGQHLPQSFTDKIESSITWLLILSNLMADTAGHSRYLFEEDNERKIYVPEESQLAQLKQAVIFSKAHIIRIAEALQLALTDLKHFVFDEQTLPPDYDPDDLILLERPILELEHDYIFMVPSAVVQCAISFIKQTALELGCEVQLQEAYYDWQWQKIIEHAYQMGWQLTDIQLPQTGTGISVTEGIFRFDNDKLAYVCLVKHASHSHESEEQPDTFENVQDTGSPYEVRHREVIGFLQALNGTDTYRYLTLYLLGTIGENLFFSWPKPSEGNQTLAFGFNDFEALVFHGGIDRLSLWKFAKAHSKASEKTQFGPFFSLLDSYVHYIGNHYSVLPTDDAVPNLMIIDIGMSAQFERDALAKRDEHAVKRIYKGQLADTPVVRHKEYAPIYVERQAALHNRLLIESFLFPLWIVNTQATSRDEKSAVNDFVEAVAFWMFKLSSLVKEKLIPLGRLPIEIEVILHRDFLHPMEPFIWKELHATDVSIAVSVAERVIRIEVPIELVHLLILEHNEAERHVMKAVLSGLNTLLAQEHSEQLTADFITQTVDEAIPFGRAKMILLLDASKDPRLDTSTLLPKRYIQEAETSFILDNLVGLIHPSKPIPDTIGTIAEKKILCRNIVSALIQEIEKKLATFDARQILEWLLRYNERYVFERQFRTYQIPARIACFSDFPNEVARYLKSEGELVRSALSVRCLIEFVAANPQYGGHDVNIDDLDELLALMNEVCQWGVISDAIHFGMDDPRMGLLPSGRIGISHDFFDKTLQPFSAAKAENDIYDYAESFEEKLKIPTSQEPAIYTEEAKELDDACLAEWGISFTKLMQLKRALIQMAIAQNASVMHIEESELSSALQKHDGLLSNADISAGLALLSLTKRASISSAPTGFSADDIYPWRYNRRLSYIQRPIIKLISPDDNKNYYYWGFRHVLVAGENLRSLIRHGRIKARDGGLLDSFVAKINAQKGDEFRQEVYEWLTCNTELEVIPYEVTIRPGGHLVAVKDYGDIDVLAIDKVAKIAYSVECKNTVSARVVHEMKTELDKYLGRDGEQGMIQKHVERDIWLQSHKGSLGKFVEVPDDYQVNSIVVTAEEIPTIYLAKDKLPLPLYGFPILRRRGWASSLTGSLPA